VSPLSLSNLLHFSKYISFKKKDESSVGFDHIVIEAAAINFNLGG
jgi:hypothetical protein